MESGVQRLDLAGAHPRPAAPPRLLLLLYSLCYISFQNSTPHTHNAVRLKGAAGASRRGDGERLKGNAEPSASAIALLPLPGGVGVHPRPRPRVGRGSFVEEKGPFFHL